MKAFTPEISWHNRLAALSLDISKPIDERVNLYRVATGGNDCRVYIWLIDTGAPKNPDIRIRAGLRRHQKSVGAVRFSQQHVLASGDDDGYIYLWKHKLDHDQQQLQQSVESNSFLNDDGFEDLELWQQQKVLRGHIEDICDLAWSKDGLYLLSGSVDNSAILWDALKGVIIWRSDSVDGYVQGVAIDPHFQYMAAISSNRTLRIYNCSEKKLINTTRRMNIKDKFKAFFCDDTVQTFCRRLEFSPDGQFLIAPTSRMIEKETDKEQSEQPQEQQTEAEDPQVNTITTKIPKKPSNVFLIFKRSSFSKPAHYYPTGREVALCARFSPVLYKLRDNETNFWGIPYRLVFAVATSRSVLIYDSQQPAPIGYASQIHLARLTDLAWSSDGRLLMISSYDGYSTLLLFDNGEFGEVYTGEPLPIEQKSADKVVVEGVEADETPSKKGQKRARKEPMLVKREKKVEKKEEVSLPTMWKYIKRT